MNFKVSVGHLVCVIWMLGVSAKQIGGNGENFVPVTQQPLMYFPQPRIVGGQNAQDNQFPHQISLLLYNIHICGGSIISKNYIVTAAHCVSTISGSSIQMRQISKMSVHAGSRDVKSGGVVIGVSEAIVHPDYREFENDIAIVKLKKPLEFNESIRAIALATQRPKVGAKIVTSGWGRLRTDGAFPQILQFNTLVLISNNACRRLIGNVPTSTLCLGHTVGNGVCNGDSGGPAVLNNQLVGVTNFVVGGCGSNSPDGYASVADFSKWIRSVTNLK